MNYYLIYDSVYPADKQIVISDTRLNKDEILIEHYERWSIWSNGTITTFKVDSELNEEIYADYVEYYSDLYWNIENMNDIEIR